MVTTGLIVRLDAQPGKEEELAMFLVDALPLVASEPQTVAWFALKTSDSSFAIVDVFPDEAGRQAHLDGPVAAALIEKAAKARRRFMRRTCTTPGRWERRVLRCASDRWFLSRDLQPAARCYRK